MAKLDSNRERRVKQLKACAESILDMAEDIIGDEGLAIDWKITIDIKCNQVPEIIVKRSVTTERILESLG